MVIAKNCIDHSEFVLNTPLNVREAGLNIHISDIFVIGRPELPNAMVHPIDQQGVNQLDTMSGQGQFWTFASFDPCLAVISIPVLYGNLLYLGNQPNFISRIQRWVRRRYGTHLGY